MAVVCSPGKECTQWLWEPSWGCQLTCAVHLPNLNSVALSNHYFIQLTCL